MIPSRASLLACAAILGAVAVVALVACGEGEDGDDGSPESSPAAQPGDADSPTKARYIAGADAICRDAVREIGRLGARFGAGAGAANPVEATTEMLFAPGLEIRKRQAERLGRLERPAEGGEDLDAYLDLFGPIEELIAQRVRAGRGGDLEDARGLESLIADLAEEQRQAALRFGFRDCGYDFVGATFPTGSSE